jgi:PilZ domain
MGTMMLADGTVLECPMLDVSGSGISIVTPIKPMVGTEVIFANERAVIVRHHDEGVALEFVNQRLEVEDAFNASLTPSLEKMNEALEFCIKSRGGASAEFELYRVA